MFRDCRRVQAVAGAIVHGVAVYEEDFAIGLIGGDGVASVGVHVEEVEATGEDRVCGLEEILGVRTGFRGPFAPFCPAGAFAIMWLFGHGFGRSDEVAKSPHHRERRARALSTAV